mgnify:CR=1 FL=1
MQIVSFSAATGTHLERCDVEGALVRWGDRASSFYVHVSGFEHDELADWLAQFKLSDFAQRRVLRMGQFTKVIAAKDALIVELRVLGEAWADAPGQIVFLCLQNLIISFEKEPVVDPDKLAAEIERLTILTALLLNQVHRLSEEVHQARTTIFELDQRMDRDPASVSLEEILDLKDHLLKMLAVAEEQSACVDAVNSVQSEMIDFDGVQGSRNLLVAAAPATERMAVRLEKRIADLRERYDTFQQEKTNRRLAVLTILSAVFLPLSLIAGIWGMNFAVMPELQHPWAYYVALGLMATIATGMVLFFRSRGWFE